MSRVKCECGDCGKQFLRGEQGDNERFCLRCERIGMANVEAEHDYYDEPSRDYCASFEY